MIKVDQFSAANEAAVHQLAQLAQLSLENVEKFAEISLGAARESVEQATRHAAALVSAKDPQQVIALNSAALEPAMKRAYAVSRTMYEAAAATQAELKKVMEVQAAELNSSAVASMEEAFKFAPSGSEQVVANMKSAFAAAQNAYANLAAMNKQLFDTVEKAVEQNVATVQAATKATSPKAAPRKGAKRR